MGDLLLRQTVGAVMHQNPKTIAATALAADALGVMNRFAITSLFVVDEGGRPVGFLHMHDCLRAGCRMTRRQVVPVSALNSRPEPLPAVLGQGRRRPASGWRRARPTVTAAASHC